MTEIEDTKSSPFATPMEVHRLQKTDNIFESPQQIVRPKTSRVKKNIIISAGNSIINRKDAFVNDSTIFIKLDKVHLITPCRSPIVLNSPSSIGGKFLLQPNSKLNMSNIWKKKSQHSKNSFSMPKEFQQPLKF